MQNFAGHYLIFIHFFSSFNHITAQIKISLCQCIIHTQFFIGASTHFAATRCPSGSVTCKWRPVALPSAGAQRKTVNTPTSKFSLSSLTTEHTNYLFFFKISQSNEGGLDSKIFNKLQIKTVNSYIYKRKTEKDFSSSTNIPKRVKRDYNALQRSPSTLKYYK